MEPMPETPSVQTNPVWIEEILIPEIPPRAGWLRIGLIATLLLLLIPMSLICIVFGWAGYNQAPEDYVAITLCYWPPLFPLLIAVGLIRTGDTDDLRGPLAMVLMVEVFLSFCLGLAICSGPDLGTGSYTPPTSDVAFASMLLWLALLPQGLKFTLLIWGMVKVSPRK